ncbi:hypothetical protein TPAR_00508 [Tolypocladium paradoxum]|uniref:Uncharacterized protein n=1 Tax=Tolypocladium paradoxum TaxID=94208 RepID=A0A2S4LA32_9HYPO|nr:hypothetical protein TPAR_00508 [Tolypocladium paradoxum]
MGKQPSSKAAPTYLGALACHHRVRISPARLPCQTCHRLLSWTVAISNPSGQASSVMRSHATQAGTSDTSPFVAEQCLTPRKVPRFGVCCKLWLCSYPTYLARSSEWLCIRLSSVPTIVSSFEEAIYPGSAPRATTRTCASRSLLRAVDAEIFQGPTLLGVLNLPKIVDCQPGRHRSHHERPRCCFIPTSPGTTPRYEHKPPGRPLRFDPAVPAVDRSRR